MPSLPVSHLRKPIIVGYDDHEPATLNDFQRIHRSHAFFCHCFKTSLHAKPFLQENEFDLHENGPVGGTHFHLETNDNWEWPFEGFLSGYIIIRRTRREWRYNTANPS